GPPPLAGGRLQRPPRQARQPRGPPGPPYPARSHDTGAMIPAPEVRKPGCNRSQPARRNPGNQLGYSFIHPLLKAVWRNSHSDNDLYREIGCLVSFRRFSPPPLPVSTTAKIGFVLSVSSPRRATIRLFGRRFRWGVQMSFSPTAKIGFVLS